MPKKVYPTYYEWKNAHDSLGFATTRAAYDRYLKLSGVKSKDVINLNSGGTPLSGSPSSVGKLASSLNQGPTFASSNAVVSPAQQQQAANNSIVVRGSGPGKRSIRIKHKESVDVITTSTVKSFRVNPVDATTFSYLSTIAPAYDSYKVHSIKFVVISSAATSTSGRYTIAWDPDSSDASPLDSVTAMSYPYSASSPVWQNVDLKLPSSQKLFCSFVPDSTRDHGTFHILTNNTERLDVYVDYDVELFDVSTVGNSAFGEGSTFWSNFNAGSLAKVFGPQFFSPSLTPTSKVVRVGPGFWLFYVYISGATALTLSADNGVTVTSKTSAGLMMAYVPAPSGCNVTLGVTGSVAVAGVHYNVIQVPINAAAAVQAALAA